MFTRLVSRYARVLMAVMILAVLALSLPQPVSAAVPGISVSKVKADETVTIRTRDFPANINFTVRMDVAGNWAIDGIVVGQTNSGIGGAFEVTYKIPAELKGAKTIAIRLESTEGYYAATWFNNRTTETTSSNPAPVPVTGNSTPAISFLGVKSNDSVTVEARNLPANTTFTVRVGPYDSFFKNYVYAPSVNSDANGYVKFTISLPDVVKNVGMVTVRIDGSGRYAFNAFKNVDSGTTGTTIPVTSSGTCQVVSATPSSPLPIRADFDMVWTIKNTSSQTWDAAAVDYKFVSGTQMHKRGDRFDLNTTVKPGETVKVIVDAIGPDTTGFFTTNWALVQGGTTLCNLPLTLRVR